MNQAGRQEEKILTIQEVSEFLKIPVSSLYALTKSGKIPAVKVGKHWRYLESELLKLWPGRIMRLTSWVVILTFLFTNISWAQPAVQGQAVSAMPVMKVLTEKLEIPEDLGSIQAEHRAGDGSPYVVYIQDAHAILDAQTKIEKLIGYLQDEYGIGLVALEGGEGELDPTLLRTFPDEFVKRRVMESYLRRGELTGAQMAAIFHPGNAAYFGIEDWKIYEENYLAYLKTREKQEIVFSKLNEIKAGLDQERETIYSQGLNEFHKKVSGFYDQKTSLLDLLKHLKTSGRIPDSAKYPHLVIVFDSIGDADSVLQSENLDIAIRNMASGFKKKYVSRLDPQEQRKFNEFHQTFLSGQIDAAAFLKYLIETARTVGLQPKLTAEMKQLLGYSETLASIKGTRIFDELGLFLESIETQLVTSAGQRELADRYKHLKMLQDLAALELTRSQFTQFQESPESYLDLMGASRNLLNPSLEFYRLALVRDDIFHTKIESLLKKQKQKSVIVLAGGFHSTGIEETFRQKGYSYVVVTPRIGSLDGIEAYHPVMEGKLSYRKFFRTTLYDAFMQDASIRMMNELDEPAFKRVIKTWRDDTIRNLSDRGRIATSGAHTRYIDLLFKTYYDHYGTGSKKPKNREELIEAIREDLDVYRKSVTLNLWNQFQTKFTRISEGMRALISRNELTQSRAETLVDEVRQFDLAGLSQMLALAPNRLNNPALGDLFSGKRLFIVETAMPVSSALDALDQMAGNANVVPVSGANAVSVAVNEIVTGTDTFDVIQMSITPEVSAPTGKQAAGALGDLVEQTANELNVTKQQAAATIAAAVRESGIGAIDDVVDITAGPRNEVHSDESLIDAAIPSVQAAIEDVLGGRSVEDYRNKIKIEAGEFKDVRMRAFTEGKPAYVEVTLDGNMTKEGVDLTVAQFNRLNADGRIQNAAFKAISIAQKIDRAERERDEELRREQNKAREVQTGIIAIIPVVPKTVEQVEAEVSSAESKITVLESADLKDPQTSEALIKVRAGIQRNYKDVQYLNLNAVESDALYARIRDVMNQTRRIAIRINTQSQPEGTDNAGPRSEVHVETVEMQTVEIAPGKTIPLPKRFYHGTQAEISRGETLKPGKDGVIWLATDRNAVAVTSRAKDGGRVIPVKLTLRKVLLARLTGERFWEEAQSMADAGYDGWYDEDKGHLAYVGHLRKSQKQKTAATQTGVAEKSQPVVSQPEALAPQTKPLTAVEGDPLWLNIGGYNFNVAKRDLVAYVKRLAEIPENKGKKISQDKIAIKLQGILKQILESKKNKDSLSKAGVSKGKPVRLHLSMESGKLIYKLRGYTAGGETRDFEVVVTEDKAGLRGRLVDYGDMNEVINALAAEGGIREVFKNFSKSKIELNERINLENLETDETGNYRIVTLKKIDSKTNKTLASVTVGIKRSTGKIVNMKDVNEAVAKHKLKPATNPADFKFTQSDNKNRQSVIYVPAGKSTAAAETKAAAATETVGPTASVTAVAVEADNDIVIRHPPAMSPSGSGTGDDGDGDPRRFDSAVSLPLQIPAGPVNVTQNGETESDQYQDSVKQPSSGAIENARAVASERLDRNQVQMKIDAAVQRTANAKKAAEAKNKAINLVLPVLRDGISSKNTGELQRVIGIAEKVAEDHSIQLNDEFYLTPLDSNDPEELLRTALREAKRQLASEDVEFDLSATEPTPDGPSYARNPGTPAVPQSNETGPKGGSDIKLPEAESFREFSTQVNSTVEFLKTVKGELNASNLSEKINSVIAKMDQIMENLGRLHPYDSGSAKALQSILHRLNEEFSSLDLKVEDITQQSGIVSRGWNRKAVKLTKSRWWTLYHAVIRARINYEELMILESSFSENVYGMPRANGSSYAEQEWRRYLSNAALFIQNPGSKAAGVEARGFFEESERYAGNQFAKMSDFRQSDDNERASRLRLRMFDDVGGLRDGDMLVGHTRGAQQKELDFAFYFESYAVEFGKEKIGPQTTVRGYFIKRGDAAPQYISFPAADLQAPDKIFASANVVRVTEIISNGFGSMKVLVPARKAKQGTKAVPFNVPAVNAVSDARSEVREDAVRSEVRTTPLELFAQSPAVQYFKQPRFLDSAGTYRDPIFQQLTYRDSLGSVQDSRALYGELEALDRNIGMLMDRDTNTAALYDAIFKLDVLRRRLDRKPEQIAKDLIQGVNPKAGTSTQVPLRDQIKKMMPALSHIQTFVSQSAQGELTVQVIDQIRAGLENSPAANKEREKKDLILLPESSQSLNNIQARGMNQNIRLLLAQARAARDLTNRLVDEYDSSAPDPKIEEAITEFLPPSPAFGKFTAEDAKGRPLQVKIKGLAIFGVVMERINELKKVLDGLEIKIEYQHANDMNRNVGNWRYLREQRSLLRRELDVEVNKWNDLEAKWRAQLPERRLRILPASVIKDLEQRIESLKQSIRKVKSDAESIKVGAEKALDRATLDVQNQKLRNLEDTLMKLQEGFESLMESFDGILRERFQEQEESSISDEEFDTKKREFIENHEKYQEGAALYQNVAEGGILRAIKESQAEIASVQSLIDKEIEKLDRSEVRTEDIADFRVEYLVERIRDEEGTSNMRGSLRSSSVSEQLVAVSRLIGDDFRAPISQAAGSEFNPNSLTALLKNISQMQLSSPDLSDEERKRKEKIYRDLEREGVAVRAKIYLAKGEGKVLWPVLSLPVYDTENRLRKIKNKDKAEAMRFIPLTDQELSRQGLTPVTDASGQTYEIYVFPHQNRNSFIPFQTTRTESGKIFYGSVEQLPKTAAGGAVDESNAFEFKGIGTKSYEGHIEASVTQDEAVLNSALEQFHQSYVKGQAFEEWLPVARQRLLEGKKIGRGTPWRIQYDVSRNHYEIMKPDQHSELKGKPGKFVGKRFQRVSKVYIGGLSSVDESKARKNQKRLKDNGAVLGVEIGEVLNASAIVQGFAYRRRSGSGIRMTAIDKTFSMRRSLWREIVRQNNGSVQAIPGQWLPVFLSNFGSNVRAMFKANLRLHESQGVGKDYDLLGRLYDVDFEELLSASESFGDAEKRRINVLKSKIFFIMNLYASMVESTEQENPYSYLMLSEAMLFGTHALADSTSDLPRDKKELRAHMDAVLGNEKAGLVKKFNNALFDISVDTSQAFGRDSSRFDDQYRDMVELLRIANPDADESLRAALAVIPGVSEPKLATTRSEVRDSPVTSARAETRFFDSVPEMQEYMEKRDAEYAGNIQAVKAERRDLLQKAKVRSSGSLEPAQRTQYDSLSQELWRIRWHRFEENLRNRSEIIMIEAGVKSKKNLKGWNWLKRRVFSGFRKIAQGQIDRLELGTFRPGKQPEEAIDDYRFGGAPLAVMTVDRNGTPTVYYSRRAGNHGGVIVDFNQDNPSDALAGIPQIRGQEVIDGGYIRDGQYVSNTETPEIRGKRPYAKLKRLIAIVNGENPSARSETRISSADMPRPLHSARFNPERVKAFLDAEPNSVLREIKARIINKAKRSHVSQQELEKNLRGLARKINRLLSDEDFEETAVLFDDKVHSSAAWTYHLAKDYLRRPPGLELYTQLGFEDRIRALGDKAPKRFIVFDDGVYGGDHAHGFKIVIQTAYEELGLPAPELIFAIPYWSKKGETYAKDPEYTGDVKLKILKHKKIPAISDVLRFWERKYLNHFMTDLAWGLNTGLLPYDHTVPDFKSFPTVLQDLIDFGNEKFKSRTMEPYLRTDTEYYRYEEKIFAENFYALATQEELNQKLAQHGSGSEEDRVELARINHVLNVKRARKEPLTALLRILMSKQEGDTITAASETRNAQQSIKNFDRILSAMSVEQQVNWLVSRLLVRGESLNFYNEDSREVDAELVNERRLAYMSQVRLFELIQADADSNRIKKLAYETAVKLDGVPEGTLTALTKKITEARAIGPILAVDAALPAVDKQLLKSFAAEFFPKESRNVSEVKNNFVEVERLQREHSDLLSEIKRMEQDLAAKRDIRDTARSKRDAIKSEQSQIDKTLQLKRTELAAAWRKGPLQEVVDVLERRSTEMAVELDLAQKALDEINQTGRSLRADYDARVQQVAALETNIQELKARVPGIGSLEEAIAYEARFFEFLKEDLSNRSVAGNGTLEENEMMLQHGLLTKSAHSYFSPLNDGTSWQTMFQIVAALAPPISTHSVGRNDTKRNFWSPLSIIFTDGFIRRVLPKGSGSFAGLGSRGRDDGTARRETDATSIQDQIKNGLQQKTKQETDEWIMQPAGRGQGIGGLVLLVDNGQLLPDRLNNKRFQVDEIFEFAAKWGIPLYAYGEKSGETGYRRITGIADESIEFGLSEKTVRKIQTEEALVSLDEIRSQPIQFSEEQLQKMTENIIKEQPFKEQITKTNIDSKFPENSYASFARSETRQAGDSISTDAGRSLSLKDFFNQNSQYEVLGNSLAEVARTFNGEVTVVTGLDSDFIDEGRAALVQVSDNNGRKEITVSSRWLYVLLQGENRERKRLVDFFNALKTGQKTPGQQVTQEPTERIRYWQELFGGAIVAELYRGREEDPKYLRAMAAADPRGLYTRYREYRLETHATRREGGYGWQMSDPKIANQPNFRFLAHSFGDTLSLLDQINPQSLRLQVEIPLSASVVDFKSKVLEGAGLLFQPLQAEREEDSSVIMAAPGDLVTGFRGLRATVGQYRSDFAQRQEESDEYRTNTPLYRREMDASTILALTIPGTFNEVLIGTEKSESKTTPQEEQSGVQVTGVFLTERFFENYQQDYLEGLLAFAEKHELPVILFKSTGVNDENAYEVVAPRDVRTQTQSSTTGPSTAARSEVRNEVEVVLEDVKLLVENKLITPGGHILVAGPGVEALSQKSIYFISRTDLNPQTAREQGIDITHVVTTPYAAQDAGINRAMLYSKASNLKTDASIVREEIKQIFKVFQSGTLYVHVSGGFNSRNPKEGDSQTFWDQVAADAIKSAGESGITIAALRHSSPLGSRKTESADPNIPDGFIQIVVTSPPAQPPIVYIKAQKIQKVAVSVETIAAPEEGYEDDYQIHYGEDSDTNGSRNEVRNIIMPTGKMVKRYTQNPAAAERWMKQFAQTEINKTGKNVWGLNQSVVNEIQRRQEIDEFLSYLYSGDLEADIANRIQQSELSAVISPATMAGRIRQTIENQILGTATLSGMTDLSRSESMANETWEMFRGGAKIKAEDWILGYQQYQSTHDGQLPPADARFGQDMVAIFKSPVILDIGAAGFPASGDQGYADIMAFIEGYVAGGIPVGISYRGDDANQREIATKITSTYGAAQVVVRPYSAAGGVNIVKSFSSVLFPPKDTRAILPYGVSVKVPAELRAFLTEGIYAQQESIGWARGFVESSLMVLGSQQLWQLLDADSKLIQQKENLPLPVMTEKFFNFMINFFNGLAKTEAIKQAIGRSA